VWTKDESSLARRWGMTAKEELSAYFTGQLRSFSTPSDLSGLPLFTQAVLKITAKIPYGEVRSYRWVAERLGKPKAARVSSVLTGPLGATHLAWIGKESC
jgi:O6-methylguanine-DNA--protein-cysteine methyltransferase